MYLNPVIEETTNTPYKVPNHKRNNIVIKGVKDKDEKKTEEKKLNKQTEAWKGVDIWIEEAYPKEIQNKTFISDT